MFNLTAPSKLSEPQARELQVIYLTSMRNALKRF